MTKILICVLLLSPIAYAKSCEAYNNMKHTKNTHHVLLGDKGTYRIVRKHKGQYLVVIKDEQPAQRWVDAECIDIDSNNKNTKPIEMHNAKKSQNKKSIKYKRNIKPTQKSRVNLLVVSWNNAFCQTHRSKIECKAKASSNILSLHGLWPQPRNKLYCNIPKKLIAKDKHHQWRDLPDMNLEPQTISLMKKYMPGYASGLEKHEWTKHGSCYGKSENEYYKDALTLTKSIDESKLGKLFRDNIGKKLSLKQIKGTFDDEFGKGAGDSIVLKCKNGLITELWITLKGDGADLSALAKNSVIKRSRCSKGIVDPSGY